MLVDGEAKPLGPCHTITDRRAAAEAEAIPPDIVAALAASSGNLPATHLILPKLLWWKGASPRDLGADGDDPDAQGYRPPFPDRHRWGSDPTDSGNTMLFDPVRLGLEPAAGRNGGHRPRQARAAHRLRGHRPGRCFPRPPRSWDCRQASRLSPAQRTWRRRCSRTGIDLADDVALTIGTSATVIAGLSRVEPALLGAMNINVSLDRGVLYAIGSHFGGGGALNWLASVATGAAEPDPALVRPGDGGGGRRAARQRGSRLPALSLGRRQPRPSTPRPRGAFLGLSMKHGRGHMLRAIVEGVHDRCRGEHRAARLGRRAKAHRLHRRRARAFRSGPRCSPTLPAFRSSIPPSPTPRRSAPV